MNWLYKYVAEVQKIYRAAYEREQAMREKGFVEQTRAAAINAAILYFAPILPLARCFFAPPPGS